MKNEEQSLSLTENALLAKLQRKVARLDRAKAKRESAFFELKAKIENLQVGMRLELHDRDEVIAVLRKRLDAIDGFRPLYAVNGQDPVSMALYHKLSAVVRGAGGVAILTNEEFKALPRIKRIV